MRLPLLCIFPLLLGGLWSADAEVPRLINHQGRMAVNGVPFQGTGQFRFALMNGDGTTTFWSNDSGGATVSLSVSQGLYSVLLGDTSLTHMTAIPPEVFANGDVRLRVWFNDGVNGSQQITPDQRLAAMPYSLMAARVEHVLVTDVKAAPVRPVLAWGGNSFGQTTVPASLTNASVTSISACGSSCLALLRDGTVVRWGSSPAVPAGLSNVTAIAAGFSHCLARRSDGSVVAWGDNALGQATVPPGLNAVTVAAGEKHSAALLTNGTVTVWGDNTFNQTGVPAGLSGVAAIAAGYDHTLALTTSGNVVAWGRNETGQTDVPAGLSGVVAIAAGAYHSLAVKQDGSVVAWGWNAGGQTSVPANAGFITAVAGGYNFSAGLRSDGTVIVWGDNSAGEQTIPAEAVQVNALAAGASSVLALRASLVPANLARLDENNRFTGKVGIGRAASANMLEVEGPTSKTTAGNWLANSDRRIKDDVKPVTGALEKLDQVRLVDFRYTADYLAAHPGTPDRRYLNVIAQEFQKIFPEHVQSSGEKLADGSSILQVDTYPLTIYSAAAVQELHRENETLKQKLAGQEERLRRLEEALSKKP